MSFSSEVKNELYEHIPKQRHCRIAELAAIILFDGKISEKGGNTQIRIMSENESLWIKYFTLLKKTISIDECGQLNEPSDAVVLDGELALELKKLLKLSSQSDGLVDGMIVQQMCCKRAFIRGAFISSGSISDPTKGYHFEIVCRSAAQASQLQDIINSFDCDAKTVERKGHFVVYIKEGEKIVDMLNVMEASVSLMNLENIRILKEMRNSVNRKVNCETANISKTVSAAVRQVEDIQFLEEEIGLDSLPNGLKEIAYLRLENPESSLIDLGQMLSPTVGKSGVNHRLRRLSDMADKLRESRG